MYSELLWEHYQSPCNRHRQESFDRSARKVNPVCPDIVEFFLRLEGQDRVAEMSFVSEACPPVVALASLLCEWATGRQVEQLRQVNEADLVAWIGPLPPNKRHAVQLTLLALEELVGKGPFNPTVESV